MSGCEQFLARLSEYFDRELAAAEMAACDAHRAECAACAQAWAGFERSVGWLRDTELLTPAPGMEARLRERLERDLPAAGGRTGGWRGWFSAAGWRPLAAAAAMVLVAGAVFQVRGASVVASGWLSDEHCVPKYCTHPYDHPRECMLSSKCQAGQFGLIDAQGRFEPFDTQGSRSAVAALQASALSDHIWATVTARKGFTAMLRVQRLQLSPGPAATAGGARGAQLAAIH